MGGYTWSRGPCHSRLDYIFVSKTLLGNIVNVATDWAFDNLDHAAVSCKLEMSAKISKGPGIARINCSLLDNKAYKEEIGKSIKEYLNQIPDYWNPHTKLEFVKLSIRSSFAEISNKANKFKN